MTRAVICAALIGALVGLSALVYEWTQVARFNNAVFSLAEFPVTSN